MAGKTRVGGTLLIVLAVAALATASRTREGRATTLTPMTVRSIATVDRVARPAGATVSATIGGAPCGVTTTAADGSFNLIVNSAAQAPGCGTDGAQIGLAIDGYIATSTFTFTSGGYAFVNTVNAWSFPGTPPPVIITPTRTPTPTPAGALPGRFQGSLTMWGKKPAGSLTVTAYIDGIACGSAPVRSGAYGITVKREQDLPGCGRQDAPVRFKVGDYWLNEGGRWNSGIPQSVDLTGPKVVRTPMAPGCTTQLTLTFSDKTPIKSVRAAVQPAEALVAIWRWNGAAARWDADFPTAPDALNTLKTVDRLDVVWVCASAIATIDQPALDP